MTVYITMRNYRKREAPLCGSTITEHYVLLDESSDIHIVHDSSLGLDHPVSRVLLSLSDHVLAQISLSRSCRRPTSRLRPMFSARTVESSS